MWGNLMKTQETANEQWKALKTAAIISPGAFSFSASESRQIARATVGEGTIIVRDNPDMDLSGLNRDPALAMTEEKTRNTSIALGPPFEYLDTALSVPKIIDSAVGTAAKIWEGIKEKWGDTNAEKPN